MGFKRFYLNEGGNAVSNVTRINQENVEATLNDIYKKLLPKLGVKVKDTASLGSTGKKNLGSSSGDIDLAVDIAEITKNKEVASTKDMFDFILKQMKSFGYDTADLRSLGLHSVAWPIQNGGVEDRTQEGEYVQLDIMPTDNLDWVQWSFYSPAEWESQWKGLYRNELLLGVAKFMDFKVLKKVMNKEGEEVPAEWERNFFDLSKGLLKGKQTKLGKKGNLLKGQKTIEKALVNKDPNQVVDMMFGPKYKPSDMLTWDDAFKAVTSSDFIYKKDAKKILKFAYDGITAKGVTVPEELKKYG